MTTHVRHLKTEFADDPTDPAQLVGSQAKYEFLGFFSEKKKKKKNFGTSPDDVTFFALLKD